MFTKPFYSFILSKLAEEKCTKGHEGLNTELNTKLYNPDRSSVTELIRISQKNMHNEQWLGVSCRTDRKKIKNQFVCERMGAADRTRLNSIRPQRSLWRCQKFILLSAECRNDFKISGTLQGFAYKSIIMAHWAHKSEFKTEKSKTSFVENKKYFGRRFKLQLVYNLFWRVCLGRKTAQIPAILIHSGQWDTLCAKTQSVNDESKRKIKHT
jgi:hypothetical protein